MAPQPRPPGRHSSAPGRRQRPTLLILTLVAVLVATACTNSPDGTPTSSTTATAMSATTAATETPTTTSTTVPVELARPQVTVLDPTSSDLALSLEVLMVPDAAIDESRITSMVRGGPGLLAVGAIGYEGEPYGDAAVWVSTDGESWERLPNADDVFDSDRTGFVNGDQWMADIVAWQGGFVAVGSDGGGQNAIYDAAVWLSDDGISWTRVPHQESLEGGWMTAVTVGGPGLVAVGEWPHSEGRPEPKVWLSEDGITWTSVDRAAIEGADGRTERVPPGWGGAAMADVAVGGPGLIAVGTDDPYYPGRGLLGGDPSVWVSSDGRAWDQILLDNGSTGADTKSGVRRLAVSPNGTIAAVGMVGDLPAPTGRGTNHQMAAVWISEDAIAWRLAGVFEEDEHESHAGAALWDGETLIVVGTVHDRGEAAVVWATSDLGGTWHQIAQTPYDRPPAQDHGIMWGPGDALFYGTPHAMSDVTTFGSQLVAVGYGVVWLGSWSPD